MYESNEEKVDIENTQLILKRNGTETVISETQGGIESDRTLFTIGTEFDNYFTDGYFGDDDSVYIKTYVPYSASKNSAYDNLGDVIEGKKISAGSIRKESSKISSYRGIFYGYKTASNKITDITNITSDQVRSLENKIIEFPNDGIIMETELMQQLIFAFPKTKGVNNLDIINIKSGSPVTVEPKSGAMVEGANGYKAVEYDIFYVSSDAPDSGMNKYEIKLL